MSQKYTEAEIQERILYAATVYTKAYAETVSPFIDLDLHSYQSNKALKAAANSAGLDFERYAGSIEDASLAELQKINARREKIHLTTDTNASISRNGYLLMLNLLVSIIVLGLLIWKII